MKYNRTRIKGRFISVEADRLIKTLAEKSGKQLEDYISDNKKLLVKVIEQPTNFNYSANMDNVGSRFFNYYKKDYVFRDENGNKINEKEVLKFVESLEKLREYEGVASAIINYGININKKNIILNKKDIKSINKIARKKQREDSDIDELENELQDIDLIVSGRER